MSSPMRVGSLQRPSANTVQLDERCLHWCGLFAAIDHISGAVVLLFARITIHCSGCETLKNRRDRWLVGWTFWLSMTFRLNIDLGYSTVTLMHCNADALSRLPCKQCGLQTSAPPPGLPNPATSPGLPDLREGDSVDGTALWQEGTVCFLSVDDPKRLQDEDPDLRQVILWLQRNMFPSVFPRHESNWVQTLWSQKDHLVLDGGVLYRRWEDVPGKGVNPHLQLVIPKTSIQTVLKEFHDTLTGGHFGFRKTMEKIRSRFYWPGQRHDVENWCKACAKCASRKSPTRRRRAPMQSGLVGTPMQRVAMDILGPLPVTARENK